jgi:phosphoribosylformimino-5-aminoimidazole carboxamide ribotide isomerase
VAAVIVYPAIDLKDGRCVRLVRGAMESATVFNEDPAAQARTFAAAGAAWIHVVDLDGAFAGRPRNAAAVESVVQTTRANVQLGGGIRDQATVEAWLGKGVARIVLGTAAVKNPNLVRETCRRWPGRVALGIDARGGKVAVEGWAETSSIAALDLARRFEDAGAAAIVYTDIERDGALEGVNVEATAALARALTTPVIASGGISSLDDLAALRAHEKDGVAGAIVGRALYDGRVDLQSALALMAA